MKMEQERILSRVDGEDIAYLGKAELVRFDGFWLLRKYSGTKQEFTSIRDSTFGEDDILIVSFPKSGSSWVSHIVSLMRADCDVTQVNSRRLDQHAILIDRDGVASAKSERHPRIIKTHFDYSKLPRSFREGKGKIIYMARNPKDLVVSYYFFMKMVKFAMLDIPFDDFCRLFLEGAVAYGPWVEHLKQYWVHRDDDNFLFLNYENLQKEPHIIVKKIASFLNKRFTDDQVDVIVNESSFQKMKENPATNFEWYHERGITVKGVSQYMRKGVVGDWKNYFSPEMDNRFDELVNSELKPLGIEFSYDIKSKQQ